MSVYESVQVKGGRGWGEGRGVVGRKGKKASVLYFWQLQALYKTCPVYSRLSAASASYSYSYVSMYTDVLINWRYSVLVEGDRHPPQPKRTEYGIQQGKGKS